MTVATALAPFQKAVDAVGTVLSPVGLPPGTKLSIAEQNQVLVGVRHVESALMWLRADIANMRADSHDKDHAKGILSWQERNLSLQRDIDNIANLCGISTATLLHDRSVARAWPYQSRIAEASFTLHKTLAFIDMDIATKREWLLLAVEEGWSAAALWAAVKEDLGNRKVTVSSYMSAKDWLVERGIKFKAHDQGRTLSFEDGNGSALMVEVATYGDGIELLYTITEENVT